VLYNVCECYITPLVLYNIAKWLYNKLHNMLYSIICNMCLSIISTVIICWHTLLQGEATEVGMHKQAGKKGGKRGKAEADTLDKERHDARHAYKKTCYKAC
jgi:hypothetical protein